MSQKKQVIPEYAGHRQRMKQKLLSSATGALLDYEIIEMILMLSLPRVDVRPLAKALINEFGSLARVITAKPEFLQKISGIGITATTAFKIVQEAAHRLAKEDIIHRPILESWTALLYYCRTTMGHSRIEQFRILYLDKKNQMLKDELQEVGTIDHTPVYPREITKQALFYDASAIILIHNHPSGHVKPSTSDIKTTQEIQKACAVFNIRVHDHVIISNRNFYSFKDHGLL